MSDFPSSAQVVVIGAGIVGNSVVKHLAALGWRDIVQLDKGPLPNPGGSTGHASNFIYPVDHNKEMAHLTLDSQEQYEEMGVSVTSGGLEVARTEARLHELNRRMTSAKSWDIDSRLVTREEIEALVPFIDVDVVLGGWYSPTVSVVDSLRAGTLMREYAQQLGALSVHPVTEVLDIETDRGRISAVVTNKGRIACEYVVIACGVWSPRLARMAGASIPLTPRCSPDDRRRPARDPVGHEQRDRLPHSPRYGHVLLRAPNGGGPWRSVRTPTGRSSITPTPSRPSNRPACRPPSFP